MHKFRSGMLRLDIQINYLSELKKNEVSCNCYLKQHGKTREKRKRKKNVK